MVGMAATVIPPSEHCNIYVHNASAIASAPLRAYAPRIGHAGPLW